VRLPIHWSGFLSKPDSLPSVVAVHRRYVWFRDRSCCTRLSGDHPGPMHDDSASVGASAPGIGFLEATVHGVQSTVPQPGQLALFNGATSGST